MSLFISRFILNSAIKLIIADFKISFDEGFKYNFNKIKYMDSSSKEVKYSEIYRFI